MVGGGQPTGSADERGLGTTSAGPIVGALRFAMGQRRVLTMSEELVAANTKVAKARTNKPRLLCGLLGRCTSRVSVRSVFGESPMSFMIAKGVV